MFDGVALIKWRPNMYPLQRVQSPLSINTFAANGNRPRSIHRSSFELHSQRSPSRSSHDLSRTGTPSFYSHRLSDDEEVEEKDEFSYGFSNRRNSHEEEEYSPVGVGKKFDDFRGRNQLVPPVGGYESRNRYYD